MVDLPIRAIIRLDQSALDSARRKLEDLSSMKMPSLRGLGIAGTAIGTVIGIWKTIADRIDKLVDETKKASPMFKGIRETMDKAFNLALKPMGDIMAIFMKPFLILSLKALRTGLQAAGQVITQFRAGQITQPEAIDQIFDIFKRTAATMKQAQFEAEKILRPIQSEMEGFLTAVDISKNNFLTGMDRWNTGFKDGILLVTTGFSSINDAITREKDTIAANARETFTSIMGDIKSVAKSVLQPYGPQSVIGSLEGLRTQEANVIRGGLERTGDFSISGILTNIGSSFGFSRP